MEALPGTSSLDDEEARSATDPAVPTGILALGVASRHLGVHIDAERVLRSIRSPKKHLSSSDIMRCATFAGLRATGMRLKWTSLPKLNRTLPAIVVLRDGEAMVLVGVTRDEAGQRVTLQDPLATSATPLFLDQRAFDAIWTGEVILVQRGLKSTASAGPFDLMMVVRLVASERSMLRDIAISAAMMSLLALTPILFYRIASERVLPYHAMSTFLVLCVVVVVLVAFEVVFGVVRRYLLLRITTKVDVTLSTEVFTRVLNLPVEYFERTPAGLTMHKIAQLGRVRSFLVSHLFGTVLDAGVLFFFLPVMFFINPLLTVVVMVFAGSICGWIIFMLPSYRAKSGVVEEAEATRGAFLAQSIQGIRTVKSLALEAHQIQEWDLLAARVARLRFAEGNVANLIQAVVTPLERLMVTGSLALGVYMALIDTSPTGIAALFTFMLLSQRLASPLIQASQLINQYDEFRTAVGLIGDLVNRAPEEGRSGDGVVTSLQGHVVFSGVQFQYKGARKPALKDVDFEISRGTTLGVMGRSGSGKTTITRLLQRLNTDYSGSIKVDGVDVRNYDLRHFRSSLGVVLQENFLFSGTIRANITMAKPGATFGEMVHAARLAGAEEFIDKLPNGYETYVYEGSPNLSGGQRQRLAIARALITDPKILILDEATSALDAESEAIVNANIERISAGRTVITISHRLASLVKADAILVMEQGEVNDIGKHHELLERNEIYANLWYTQNPHMASPAQSGQRPRLTYQGLRDAS